MVRVATWHDWIFVNLNGTAPPLEDFVAPLRTWLDGIPDRIGMPGRWCGRSGGLVSRMTDKSDEQ